MWIKMWIIPGMDQVPTSANGPSVSIETNKKVTEFILISRQQKEGGKVGEIS